MLTLAPSAPAHATYNSFCTVTLTDATLPPIRLSPDGQGGVTLYSQTPGGDARFLQIRPGGGHWEISVMHSLPEGHGLELDSAGYPLVREN